MMKRTEGLTRDEINSFLYQVGEARDAWIARGRKGDLEELEFDRKVIARFNPSGMKHFDDTLYFVYSDVKIYEKGRKDEAKKIESMTMEQKLHGTKPLAS